MKLVTFEYQGRATAGVVTDHGVVDLSRLASAAGEPGDFSSVLQIVRGGDASRFACARLAQRAGPGDALATGGVKLMAPIQPSRNVFCVGRNYVDHVKEGASAMRTDLKLPEVPQFFTKATHTVVGPGADVRLDTKVTQKLDYEVELAVIVGTGGRDIPAEKAFDHIFGYTIANDVTARDLQRRHDQWFKGKSLDTTLPLGPWIIDRDAVGDPTTLQLTLSVNGQERQRAQVQQMIFDIPAIIASLSAGLTLEAGDVIATGTPSGVGFAMTPPRYLKGGDVVTARIDRIGELTNKIVEV